MSQAFRYTDVLKVWSKCVRTIKRICTNCLESRVCKDYTETIHTMSWIILCTEKKVEHKYLMKIKPFFTGSHPVQCLSVYLSVCLSVCLRRQFVLNEKLNKNEDYEKYKALTRRKRADGTGGC
jgi:hypothetical protein